MSASKIKRNMPKKHGISFTELKNRTNLENGVLQHHLHYNGLFVRKKSAVMMSDACSKCELKNLCKDSCISAIISKDVKNQVLKFLNRGLTQKEIGNAYRFIGRNTDIRVMPPQAADYIERFADELELSDEVKQTAEKIVADASEANITSGKSPRGLAATALFLAAHQKGEKRSMNEMSDVLNLTSITIRERSKEFVRELGIKDFPDHLKEGMDEYNT